MTNEVRSDDAGGLDAAIRPDGPTFQERPKATTALATQRAGFMQTAFQGLMPTTIGEAYVLAGYLAKSNGIPKSLRAGQKGGGAESVLTVILAGMELGLTPIRSLQSITNIQGNLALRADLQLALTRRAQVLALYDESYEEMGRTDQSLLARLKQLLIGPGRSEAVATKEAEAVHAKIAAAVKGMPAGKPYAWALAQRHGENVIHVRTFSWLDAEKAFVYEKDEDGEVGEKSVRKKLSEKFNYQAWPGDMYPKRARTRLLQVVSGDVLAGLPAVEQLEGGQILDADFSVVEDGGNPDVDALLAEIEDQELVTSVTSGFKQLNMGPAKQLQKLTQFRGKPAELLDWLKTEWANRKGIPRKQGDALSEQPATASAAPVQDGQVVQDEPKPAAAIQDVKNHLASVDQAVAEREAAKPAATETKPAATETKPAATETKPAATETIADIMTAAVTGGGPVEVKTEPAKVKGKVADLAARFKAGVTF